MTHPKNRLERKQVEEKKKFKEFPRPRRGIKKFKELEETEAEDAARSSSNRDIGTP